jgi:rubrerythrin
MRITPSRSDPVYSLLKDGHPLAQSAHQILSPVSGDLETRDHHIERGTKLDIIQYAMEMEKDGEKLYREMASSVGDKGLASILIGLADSEVRHFEVLEKLQKGLSAQLPKDTFPEKAKNIFRKMQEEEVRIDSDAKHTELYSRAMDLEAKTWEFYLSRAAEMEDPVAKNVLQLISEEEKRHYRILETIVEMLTRAEPGNWLENAEWFHFDEY